MSTTTQHIQTAVSSLPLVLGAQGIYFFIIRPPIACWRHSRHSMNIYGRWGRSILPRASRVSFAAAAASRTGACAERMTACWIEALSRLNAAGALDRVR